MNESELITRSLISIINNFDEKFKIYLVQTNTKPAKYGVRFNGIKDLNFSRKYNSIFFEKLFETVPEIFLYNIFGIAENEVEIDCNYSKMFIPRQTYVTNSSTEYFSEDQQLDNFQFINLINSYNAKLISYEDIPDDILSMLHYNLNVSLQSGFHSIISLKGNFTYHESIPSDLIANNSETTINLKLYGLKEDDNIDEWKVILLKSFLYYRMDNEEGAFLSAYIALDKYINEALDIINPVNLRYRLNDIENTKIYYEKEKISSDKNNHLINGKFNFLLNVTGVNNMSRTLENEQKRKRLANAIRIIQEGNYIRNGLAHGNKRNTEGKFIELVYSMILVMSYLGSGEALDQFVDCFLNEAN